MTAKNKEIFLLTCCLLCFVVPATHYVAAAEQKRPEHVLVDRQLSAYQYDLLSIAFETASAIPVHPHIKDRSKAQEAVITGLLKLHQPLQALECIKSIDNWRRGAAYADFAFYCARHGFVEDVQPCLEIAAKIAELAEQDWRRDRIKVKIARTLALLGQNQRADELKTDVDDSEVGKVEEVKAMICDDESFQGLVDTLNSLIATGNFDLVKNALHSYAELFTRFYSKSERRRQIEETIESALPKLPAFARIELMTKLVQACLDKEDTENALRFVDETQALTNSFAWPLEYRIPLIANLAVLRFRAGDVDRAKNDVNAAFALFQQEGHKIVNIYRARTLRPVAEALKQMGDPDAALEVYKRAIEEGVANPNSRPRAEDLSATCLSMASHGVEPDEELLTRINDISDGLGNPW